MEFFRKSAVSILFLELACNALIDNAVPAQDEDEWGEAGNGARGGDAGAGTGGEGIDASGGESAAGGGAGVGTSGEGIGASVGESAAGGCAGADDGAAGEAGVEGGTAGSLGGGTAGAEAGGTAGSLGGGKGGTGAGGTAGSPSGGTAGAGAGGVGSEGGTVGSAGAAGAPPPPPPPPPPTTKCYVDIFRNATGHSSPGGTITGLLKKGNNPHYVFCKVWGPEVREGDQFNHWWMLTDLDEGNPWQNQWVSAYYLEHWGNDEAKANDGKELPVCP